MYIQVTMHKEYKFLFDFDLNFFPLYIRACKTYSSVFVGKLLLESDFIEYKLQNLSFDTHQNSL